MFPLTGALLLPGGKLPLNIFEPRYLAMVEDALGAGRMFGMIQPNPQAASMPGGVGLHAVGCVGRLSSFSETDDGRYLITLTGVIRFHVAQELAMQRGYRRMQVDYAPWWQDLETASPDLGTAPRADLMQALRAYFTQRGFDANWPALQAMADEPLITSLCMACPFEPGEKQALLEAPDLAARAQSLLALLQMGAVFQTPQTRLS